MFRKASATFPRGRGQFLEKCVAAHGNVKGKRLLTWLFPNYFGISCLYCCKSNQSYFALSLPVKCTFHPADNDDNDRGGHHGTGSS